jgi:IS30 family transposase
MRCYSHLSDDEREQIGLAKALGHSIGAIAQAIGRPKSTVWRELCRNRLPSGRRWLPRQIDIDKVSDEEIQDIVMTANLTPRKCLGFKTPLQAILKELGKDVQIRFA